MPPPVEYTSFPPAVCERLRTVYGLDPATLGDTALRCAWQHRLAATRAGSAAVYEGFLARSSEEMDALVEEVLVPESWFFRDGAPFAYLEKWVREEWMPRAAGRVLRVLSAPCAAGQEAWSIAMTLVDAGLAPNQFVVHAGDLSKVFLERARLGVYPDSAFRGGDAVGREHHFEPAGPNLRRVRASLHGSVKWFHCNLIASSFLLGEAPFDVIFCRNVLIYFHSAARQHVAARLRRSLVPGGLFFAGHADGLPLLDHGYTTIGPAGAFAFRLRDGLN